MPPFTLTCIACAAPFPRNGELAAIPDAATVAFDPVQCRVWRICSCGEWNLLGPEASVAALPELDARFAAAPKRRTAGEFAPALVGRKLELLRIGPTAATTHDDTVVLRMRRSFARFRLAAIPVMGGGVVAMALMLLFAYRHHAVAGVFAEYLMLFPGVMIGLCIRRLRHKRPINRNHILGWVAALVAGMTLARLVIANWELVLIFAVVLPLVWAWQWFFPGAVLSFPRVAKGPIKFLGLSELRAVTMSWQDCGINLTLHDLPDGAVVTGDDAHDLLQLIIRYTARPRLALSRRATIEAAHDLVRSAGGLAGLFRLLEGFRRDQDGRVPIARLPRIYRLALDFALEATDAVDYGSSEAVRLAAADATAIAAHADALRR